MEKIVSIWLDIENKIIHKFNNEENVKNKIIEGNYIVHYENFSDITGEETKESWIKRIVIPEIEKQVKQKITKPIDIIIEPLWFKVISFCELYLKKIIDGHQYGLHVFNSSVQPIIEFYCKGKNYKIPVMNKKYFSNDIKSSDLPIKIKELFIKKLGNEI